ncbi:MAG TPA: ComEC family competence protein, partial [Saprospiraceae bacterium]|nr:ComEC family competence protein [Saprospiraceae bacterium]
NDNNLIIAKISEAPSIKKRVKASILLEKISDENGDWKHTTGKVLAFFERDAKTQELSYGDRIVFSSKLFKIKAPLNPRQIDFQNFYYYQNIHYQSFINEKDWHLLQKANGTDLLARAGFWRKQFLKILQQHLHNTKEYAVGAALILGYKNDLSDEMKTAYSHTGASHILAVSGMHVGLFAALIGFLLSWMKWFGRGWNRIKNLILIFCLFVFALLTGASPPVVRAVFMFSLVLIGLSLGRSPNIYNTIAASAFCLLCYNPFYLMSLSFQLSFFAVIGIVYFYPKIYKRWYIPNRFFDFFWKLTAIALAAQIATLPLTIFYFHQFPIYFLLSGWIVVPLSPLILGLGIALFAFHSFPVLAGIIGKILYGCIWLMNALIFLIQEIPQGLIEGLWISLLTVILLYSFIVMISAAFQLKNFRLVIVSAILLLGICLNFAFTSFQNQYQSKLCIYHIPKHSLMDISDGTDIYCFHDLTLADSLENRIASNNRNSFGLSPKKSILFSQASFRDKSIYYQDGFLKFRNIKLAIIREDFTNRSNHPIQIDFILIQNSPRINWTALQNSFHFKQVIFDGSNKLKSVNQWIKKCKELNIDFHYTQRDGAFVYNITN